MRRPLLLSRTWCFAQQLHCQCAVVAHADNGTHRKETSHRRATRSDAQHSFPNTSAQPPRQSCAAQQMSTRQPHCTRRRRATAPGHLQLSTRIRPHSRTMLSRRQTYKRRLKRTMHPHKGNTLEEEGLRLTQQRCWHRAALSQTADRQCTSTTRSS
jgi:hypothetical protein